MVLVNKKAVSTAFGRAARYYSQYDSLQRLSSRRLWALVASQDFTKVLDAGCGPGRNSQDWSQTGSKVTALDLSPEMVFLARERQTADSYLIADIEALPFLDGSFDLVWSHLAVQWCSSLRKALNELYRVARPKGTVAFTTLLDNSLPELHRAWLSVDPYPHVNRFLSKSEVISKLNLWRYRYIVQNITLYFDNALSAMQSLKGIGATHLHHGRAQKSLTRSALQNLELTWPKRRGQFPLTYQLFHGIIERG